jgi:hypothetical protein
MFIKANWVKTFIMSAFATLLLAACSTASSPTSVGGMSMPDHKGMNCTCCESMKSDKPCCADMEHCPCCKGGHSGAGMTCNPATGK